MRKLEIGSGNRPQEGYEHLDINPECPHLEYVAPMDKIPVEDNVFDELLSVHSIEHVSWREGLNVLKEWCRVLKPGGKLRIATPNLRFICESYVKNNGDWQKDASIMTVEEKERISVDGHWNKALWANFKLFSSCSEYDIHYTCYDTKLLALRLEQAGFSRTEVEHDGDSLIMWGFK